MKIGFLGGGKMAEGILSAIEDKKAVLIAERVPERAAYLSRRYGLKTTGDVAKVARECEVMFLAVRPQDVAAVAEAVRPCLKSGQTLVSIVAGKRISVLRRSFGGKVGLVRVMPNLALRAGAGMCAITAAPKTCPRHLALVDEILRGAGETVRLAERHFDAVTALSGSGPAYFAYMQSAMAAGGVKLGLKPAVARLLAAQTMYGTAKFLRESGMDLDEFIAGVATKGGTTAAGMEELVDPKFRQIVAKTLRAAAVRSAELGNLRYN